ncbi:MAG: hypothetical protein RLP15_08015 [Cryomorphaceae bacterium]
MKLATLILFLALIAANTKGQEFKYDLSLRAIDHEAPGIHSYAIAQNNGKWLVIGGRLDGLHARQPFNAFPDSWQNMNLRVIDPTSGETWTASSASLPSGIQEQLGSTNMCFKQKADTLYMIGGYAYSPSAADHITLPRLTTITVSALIETIINGEDISTHVKSMYDQRFAITGGQLTFIEGKALLIGGHRFDGRYNPMGHNTYEQTYSDAIRSFDIDNSGSSPSISGYSESVDAAHLHRRDYNLIAQIFGDESFGYMISSGVFQVNVDLPYLYPVEVRADGYTPRTSFNQYLSNYHSAHATLYDTINQSCHTLFFGGMARYYYENDALVQDDDVPFVRTISRLTRSSNDELTEYALPNRMPSLEGASAEFIPNPGLDMIEGEVIMLGESLDDSLMLGHIYGGISSSALNPFTENNTAATEATSVMYEVWLSKAEESTSIPLIGKHHFTAEVYPNPSDGEVRLMVNAPTNGNAFVTITDQAGRYVEHFEIRDMKKGVNDFDFLRAGQLPAGIYGVTLTLEDIYSASCTLIIR